MGAVRMRPRAFIPAAILGIGCALVFTVSRQRAMPLVRPLTALPTHLAGYRGMDVKINDAELRAAGVSNYLLRVFRRDSAEVFSVYVGYYEQQMQGKTIHSPKNCLPGNGWDFVFTGTSMIDKAQPRITINRSVVANEDQRALVYYWYQGRGRVAANEYAVKWQLLRDAARYGRSEEALVRVVVPLPPGTSGGAELARGDTIATAVARGLIGEVATVLPSWPSA